MMNYMMLLGLSKIAAGGLIPSILENSKIRIIAITTKTFNDIDIEINVVEKNCSVFSYSCKQVTENTTFEEFVSNEDSTSECRVSIMSPKCIPTIIKGLIRENKIAACISTARSGINFYLNHFKECGIYLPLNLICMDNSKTTIVNARDYCNTLGLHNIKISQGITHIICSRTIDKDGQILVTLDPVLLLTIFPPEAKLLEPYFDISHQLRNKYQMRFTNTSEEFDYLCMSKLIDVNILHTIVCMMAYRKAHAQNIHMVDAEKLPICNILSEDIIPLVAEMHDKLYDVFLAELAGKMGESKQTHSMEALLFVKHLFDGVETVGRGIKAEKSYDRDEKLERHMKFLNMVDYEPINKLVKDFLDLLS